MDDRLSGNLQDDILTLLCFDTENGRFIRNSVELKYFEGIYKDIAARVYDYIDRYKEAPGDVLPTIFDDIIETTDGQNKDKAELYKRTLANLYENKDNINVRYVIDRITTFIRRQQIKAGILEAAEILQSNYPDATERAEEAFYRNLNKRMQLFDPGTFFGDVDKVLSFLNREESEVFPTGIREFDKLGIGPARTRLYLFIGVYGSGKSWGLVDLAKRALMQRSRVCHISLEMSEDECKQRYLQAAFGLTKRQGKYAHYLFERDDDDELVGFLRKVYRPKLTFESPQANVELRKKLDKWRNRFNRLLIKQFPTKQLTIGELRAYLDNLEVAYRFVPDLLLIDYADLMKFNLDNFRLELGNVFAELRGIAMERNIALATVTQANREGGKAKKVMGTNVAEDWSKMATADNVITYSQTEHEAKHGLARLYVDKARNEKDKFTVLISQNYSIGKFVVDSIPMRDSYVDVIADLGSEYED